MSELGKAVEMAFNAAEPAMKSAIETIKKLQAENKALRQALAQPEQKREWVGLTDEEFRRFSFNAPWEVVQEIENKLKEKNGV